MNHEHDCYSREAENKPRPLTLAERLTAAEERIAELTERLDIANMSADRDREDYRIRLDRIERETGLLPA